MDGQEIIEFRKRLGMSIDEFARLCGVDSRAVARWESGSGSPTSSVENLIRGLREALDRQESERGKKVATSIAKHITGAALVGGLPYLMIKLVEMAFKDDE